MKSYMHSHRTRKHFSDPIAAEQRRQREEARRLRREEKARRRLERKASR